MRRALMLGLLVVQGWARACSIAPTSPEAIKADDNLEAAKNTSQRACASSKSECTVYKVPPEKVLEWLKLTEYKYLTPMKKDNSWIFDEGEYNGRKTVVKSSGSGTVIQIFDRETAVEKLNKYYRKADPTKASPVNCTTLGLNDPAYILGDCWLTKDNEIRVRVISAEDKSLPNGVYEYSIGPCGFSGVRTVDDEFEKSAGDTVWQRFKEKLKELFYW